MITTYRLAANELNESIIKAIKEAFKGKSIEIIISDTKESEPEKDLLKRIENLRKNKNVVSFSQDKFFKTYRKKLTDAAN